VLGFGRDIGRRSKIDATLHFLVESGWPATGEDFFESLAVWLARTLDMDYICIDRLEGENAEATTVAVWFDGTIRENIRYALRDTPCGVAVGKTICCFPEGAHRLFPRDIALQDMKAESYVGTTLRNSRGRDIGLIAIIGRRPLANREEAEAILKLVSIRAAGELERREVEAAVARASKEKEILHRELQHRVKNSFAMIVSLIQLEGLDKGERDPRVAEALADIERRVFVLSRLYSLLYEEGSTAISVEQLFTSICSSLAEAFADGRLDDISADIEPLTLEAGRAASLGLALNELLTNALKYAFPPGSCGSIRVSLRREGELWRLRVEDDGVGLPEGFSLADSGGFGFTLVRGLAEELGGHFERLGDRGASFALSFPAL
jgi:two-component sensor histidine kinase